MTNDFPFLPTSAVRHCLLLVAIVTCVLFARQNCVAQSPAAMQLGKASLAMHLAQVKAEAEAIRRHMGKPREIREELPMKRADSLELYFHTANLFGNSARLYYQFTYSEVELPHLIGEVPTIDDVDRLLAESLKQLKQIRIQLGSQSPTEVPALQIVPSSAELCRGIIQANRQLNLLLDSPTTPSDVYQHSTVAIAYAQRLIESFPNATGIIPETPAFQPGKMPADVYRRLLTCFERINRVMAISDFNESQLGTIPPEEIDRATPGDVYDIASLVVSKLAFLHSQRDGVRPPMRAYPPGRKFPSDVFQRVGILEKQLDELEKLTSANPNWLKQSNGKPEAKK